MTSSLVRDGVAHLVDRPSMPGHVKDKLAIVHEDLHKRYWYGRDDLLRRLIALRHSHALDNEHQQHRDGFSKYGSRASWSRKVKAYREDGATRLEITGNLSANEIQRRLEQLHESGREAVERSDDNPEQGPDGQPG